MTECVEQNGKENGKTSRKCQSYRKRVSQFLKDVLSQKICKFKAHTHTQTKVYPQPHPQAHTVAHGCARPGRVNMPKGTESSTACYYVVCSGSILKCVHVCVCVYMYACAVPVFVRICMSMRVCVCGIRTSYAYESSENIINGKI